MSEFFRFPHTPHIAWLGSAPPRNDKVLSHAEARALLSGELAVEEKLDGANLGFSFDDNGKLRQQNRGQYLTQPFVGQFSKLKSWIDYHYNILGDALGGSLVLFGEWCAARHSVRYTRLPDWFLVFDIYDRVAGQFWNSMRRDAWAANVGLPVVPTLFFGKTTLQTLTELVETTPSRFGAQVVEGIVLRREGEHFLETRAKLVRPSFVQEIGEHWRSRRIEWNVLTAP